MLFTDREGREFYPVSNNKVFLIDKLLAIPLAIYFWWYGYKQKLGKRRKKNSLDSTRSDGVRK